MMCGCLRKYIKLDCWSSSGQFWLLSGWWPLVIGWYRSVYYKKYHTWLTRTFNQVTGTSLHPNTSKYSCTHVAYEASIVSGPRIMGIKCVSEVCQLASCSHITLRAFITVKGNSSSLSQTPSHAEVTLKHRPRWLQYRGFTETFLSRILRDRWKCPLYQNFILSNQVGILVALKGPLATFML